MPATGNSGRAELFSGRATDESAGGRDHRMSGEATLISSGRAQPFGLWFAPAFAAGTVRSR